MPVTEPVDVLAADIGAGLRRAGHTVAVAESLTGGLLASRFARIDGASAWFRGGVVAYSPEVKYQLLGVRPGPLVSRETALDMARAVSRLLRADLALATTGVGGPDPQDDLPPGTVWIAAVAPAGERTEQHRFAGEPAEVLDAACNAAVALAAALVRGEGGLS